MTAILHRKLIIFDHVEPKNMERPAQISRRETSTWSFFDRLDIFSDATNLKNALVVFVLRVCYSESPREELIAENILKQISVRLYLVYVGLRARPLTACCQCWSFELWSTIRWGSNSSLVAVSWGALFISSSIFGLPTSGSANDLTL